MRSAPRKIDDEAALYRVALRALMRRSYSIFEMRSYLERRSADASLARHVVARLKQEKLMDDARYALEFSRGRANLRRQGRYRIARELRARGVPDRHVEAAVAQVLAETDEAAVVRKLIERRLRSVSKPLDKKKIASLYRMLLRAGFDSVVIRAELYGAMRGQVTADELPEPEVAE